MISSNDITDANVRIRPHVRQTPIVELEVGALCDHPVTLKLEQLQHSGSFKCRGAFNTLLSNDVPQAGVVAVSGGNHGAAVAYAASKLGHRSTVFVPDHTDAVKLERMRGYGAEVVMGGNDFTALIAKYEAFAKDTGALSIHPYDMPTVLAGQGTIGLELEQQAPDLDTLFISVGGGGLIGGISTWYGGLVNVVAVESEGTATYANALINGKNAVITPDGIAKGSLGAPHLGGLAYDALTKEKRRSIVVSDAQIIQAQQRLWDSTRILGEPGAATAVAALTSGAYQPATGERIGVLICGANAAPDWFFEGNKT